MTRDMPLSRSDLIKLVEHIRALQERGKDYSSHLATFKSNVPDAPVEDLLDGDYPSEYIVDYSLSWRAEWPKLSKEQLVDLVVSIMNAEGTEAEIAINTCIFDANCIHPGKSDLIYYPREYFDGNSDPSISAIVEKALSEE